MPIQGILNLNVQMSRLFVILSGSEESDGILQ